MIDASLPLQAAVVKALNEDPDLTALIGGRVYDRVPVNPVSPYITIGDAQIVDDSSACLSIAEYSIQIDAWSEAVGYPEVKQIGALAAKVLDAALPMDGFAIVIRRIRLRYGRERDNLTSRAFITALYDIQALA